MPVGSEVAGYKELVATDERDNIFETAADLLCQLAAKCHENEEAYLERTGNIVALANVLAHIFADGNGRTARVMGDLLRYGPQSDNIRIAAASRAKPGEGFRVNSYVPRRDNPYDVLYSAASLDIPLRDQDSYSAATEQAFTTPYK